MWEEIFHPCPIHHHISCSTLPPLAGLLRFSSIRQNPEEDSGSRRLALNQVFIARSACLASVIQDGPEQASASLGKGSPGPCWPQSTTGIICMLHPKTKARTGLWWAILCLVVTAAVLQPFAGPWLLGIFFFPLALVCAATRLNRNSVFPVQLAVLAEANSPVTKASFPVQSPAPGKEQCQHWYLLTLIRSP